MGAGYSFYVKTIETHARSFFKVIIFSIGSVIDKERHSFVDCELTTSHFMTLSTFVNNLDGWQS